MANNHSIITGNVVVPVSACIQCMCDAYLRVTVAVLVVSWATTLPSLRGVMNQNWWT